MKRLCLFLVGHAGEMVLVILLSALVFILYTGTYKGFLHPDFWPFLLIGALIIGGSLAVLATDFRFSTGQKKSLRSNINGTVILLPLIFWAAVNDQGMGIHAFDRKVTGTEQAALSALLSLTNDKINTEKSDGMLTLAELAAGMSRLEGTRVTTEGVFYKDPSLPEGQAKLFRFQMVCCAADALPVWVLLDGADMIEAADETWMQVSGTLQRAFINGNEVAAIAIETVDVKPTPPPSKQYLYF